MKTASFKVGSNRLLRLAAFLRTVPRKQFDYCVWGESQTGEKVKAEIGCGTKACALGWATAIPTFRKIGLKLVESTYEPNIGYVELHTKDGRILDDFDAASVLFGINTDEAVALFSPEEDVYGNSVEDKATPKQVARKIEKFVAKRQKPSKDQNQTF